MLYFKHIVMFCRPIDYDNENRRSFFEEIAMTNSVTFKTGGSHNSKSLQNKNLLT